MSFKKVEQKDLQLNPIAMFSDEWPLLTAGDDVQGYNTMTISWGHIGAIWNKPTLTVYVRPQRYTKGFMDHNDLFTISILPSTYKKALSYLGRVSGRDEDKVSNAGVTPIFGQGVTYFEESNLVFVCRKLYQGSIKEVGFLEQDLVPQMYPDKDFHTMYIGEIVDILMKE